MAIKHPLQTRADIRRLGTILGVWAHPDDETFMSAGIMLAALANGQRVACVTATRGEVGVRDPARWPAEHLAEIRTAEMRAALQVLGLRQHFWLNYHDGQCQAVTADEAATKLQRIIESLRPDSILTFGPDGWSGHSDHQAVSEWVSRAVEHIDFQVAVYHVVQSREQYQQYLKQADDKFNLFFDTAKPVLRQQSACDVCYCLPESAKAKKFEALAAMPSQTTIWFETFDHAFWDKALAFETFVRAK